jgi:hypothetical protein
MVPLIPQLIPSCIGFMNTSMADNGAGLGASHQTGWTALIAKLIQQQGEFGTISHPR